MITIEIDGRRVEVEPGSMIIEVADNLGVPIPRFCYHPELSVAASCRMCLVEVSNCPKPVPACSTPVTEGMSILTRSESTKKAQQSVTEFLLINHPLDCPVCDQAGECELQDLIMQHSKDRSAFREPKREVPNPHLGPLIGTEMNRCIHCSRCVRFGEEVAGVPEMGAVERGEDLKITNYLETALESEVSGNMIDICPVGALTSKPHRFGGRTWGFRSYPGWVGHDGFRSAVEWHAEHGKLKRLVSRPDETTLIGPWISDRDRFGYLGLKADDRLLETGFIRKNLWQKSSFAKIQQVFEELRGGLTSWGALVHPCASVADLMTLDQALKGAPESRGLALLTDSSTLSSAVTWEDILPSPRPKIVLGSFLTTDHPLQILQLRKWADEGGLVECWTPLAGDQPQIASAEMINFAGKSSDQARKIVQKRVKELIELHGTQSCDIIVAQNFLAHPWVEQWLSALSPLISQRCLWHRQPQWPGIGGCPTAPPPELLFILQAESYDWAQLPWARHWLEQAKVIVVLGGFRDTSWEKLPQDILFLPCTQLCEQQCYYPQSRPRGPELCVSEKAVNPDPNLRTAEKWLQDLLDLEPLNPESLNFWPEAGWAETSTPDLPKPLKDQTLWVIHHPLNLDAVVRRSGPLKETPWAQRARGFWLGPGVLPEAAPPQGPELTVADQEGRKVTDAYQIKPELPYGTVLYWAGHDPTAESLGQSWVRVEQGGQ